MAKPNYFKKLYKKTSTGKIQEWLIGVQGTTIVTTYGQVGGKMQTTIDYVKSGKNLGRKNETDQETQALKEATSQWLKKKKAGYVASLKDAESGKTDSVIEGGILPMLAKVYEENKSKIVFPVSVQPKLDGHRCIAVIDGKGRVSLWTRTRKRLTSVPHIESALKNLNLKNTILDGEIYADSLKSDFEKLTSAARKQEATEESKRLEYHIYDCELPVCFTERFSYLCSFLLTQRGPLKLVPTTVLTDEQEIKAKYETYIMLGYEGMMIRKHGIPYQNKRSDQLLKLKSFIDAEFKIVGVEEGRGKLTGHAGSFVCLSKNAEDRFNVKMEGATSKLKEYWENKEKYIGQLLTVRYQKLSVYGTPIFPVGVRIRKDL